MAFRKVVVLGGGPIGLFCAIEAAEQLKEKYFSKVVLVEMRSEYSRMNVPALATPIRKHLDSLPIKSGTGEKTTVAKLAGVGTNTGGLTSLSHLEEVLSKKAKSAGVVLKRGYVPVGIVGKDPRPDGRFKSAAITISKWDHATRRVAVPPKSELFQADLIVVAVGGSGVEHDVFQKTLDFEHSKLNAESYAFYGVYGKAPEGKQQLGSAASNEAKRLGDIIKLDSGDQRYLLITLKDVSPADFKRLKTNTEELRRVMSTTAIAYNNKVIGPLSMAEKAVGAFEVKIKRAKHVLSPKFPAILVGDAAVTPHPNTGTGILTGFHGFEAFREMLIALKGTNRSSEEAVDALCAFEDSYEVYIAAKALEGTVVTIEHLQGLLRGYMSSCDREASATTGSKAKYIIQLGKSLAEILNNEMEAQANRAALLGGLLVADSVRLNKATSMSDLSEKLSRKAGQGTLKSNDSVHRLWSDLDRTYKEMQELLKTYSSIGDIMSGMEGQLGQKGVNVPKYQDLRI